MEEVITTESIITALRGANGPEREIDRLITIRLGYTRKVNYRQAPDGRTLRSIFWVVPGSELIVVMPYFTSSLTDAKRLATAIAGDKSVAIGWDDDGGKAVIEGEEYCRGPNPTLALCLAAMISFKNGSGEIDAQALNLPTDPPIS